MAKDSLFFDCFFLMKIWLIHRLLSLLMFTECAHVFWGVFCIEYICVFSPSCSQNNCIDIVFFDGSFEYET